MHTPNSHPQLGRLIFERRAGSGLKVLVAFCSILVILSTIGLIAIFTLAMTSVGEVDSAVKWQGAVMMLCPISVLIFGVIMLMFIAPRLKTVFRCYQFGVELARKNNVVALPFDQLVQFRYRATKVYINFVYASTNFGINLEGTNGGTPVSIRFSYQTRNDDPQLYSLPAIACHARSAQLASQVLAGHQVPWTQHTTLTPNGLFIQRGSRSEVVRYEELRTFNLVDGRLEVWANHSTKPILKLKADKEGFYPGYFALLDLRDGIPATIDPEAFGQTRTPAPLPPVAAEAVLAEQISEPPPSEEVLSLDEYNRLTADAVVGKGESSAQDKLIPLAIVISICCFLGLVVWGAWSVLNAPRGEQQVVQAVDGELEQSTEMPTNQDQPRERPARPTPKKLTEPELEKVLELLESGDENRGRGGVIMLLKALPPDMPNSKVSQTLTTLTQSENVFVRRDATRALGPWGNKKAIETLRELASHGDIFTQREAINALAYFPSKAAAEAIATRVGEFQVSGSVNESYKKMTNHVEAAVLPLVDSERGEIKNHAFELLALYGSKKSLEKLESLVDDSISPLRQRSLINAIDKIKSRR